MDAAERHERIENEVSLLQSMYPEITFETKAQEVRFSTKHRSAKLVVRIPPTYLDSEQPIIVVATTSEADLRQQLQDYLKAECAIGEECLDRLITQFEALVGTSSFASTSPKGGPLNEAQTPAQSKATVVVWLHHLLNTNKRKQALSPPASGVNGVTKPGYPGVLIYSGPAHAVHEHVRELKSLNWQAFQVRLELEEEWIFSHGKEVIEVAEMREVVAEIGTDKKNLFMEAMRMK